MKSNQLYQRVSVFRCWSIILAVSAVVMAAAACTPAPPEHNAQQAGTDPTGPTPRWFGGYLDVTLGPSLGLLDQPPGGTVTTVLSFIGADPDMPCQPSWDGFYDLEQAGAKLDLDKQLKTFRDAGNDVAISFGGQLATELAAACTDGDALVSAYAAVITKYGLDILDFDIEGEGLADHPAAKRRAAAIARLQAARPPDTPLKVWLTLPVSTDGLTSEGKASVSIMLEAGVELAGVNIMIMNFGPLAPGQTMLAAGISAAEATHRKLTALFEKVGQPLDAAALWNRIGITPMIGTNDVKGQVFTLADAKGLNSFALARGVGRISMWSLNRDTGCNSSSREQRENGVANNCSGVPQEPGMFAKVLGSSYVNGR
ncbi:MAG: chitinase [Arthrobacter sp.]